MRQAARLFGRPKSLALAGLPFSLGSRSHIGMDESLERIIRQALDDARAKGRDHLTQTQVAVEAVRKPDLT